MSADRQDPPPGYSVEFEEFAQWVTRNPEGQVIGMLWTTRAKAVQVAWDAADALARAVRDLEPGWFAMAGDNQLGGPYDTAGEAQARLARYVDHGTFRVAYGQRDAYWVLTELPEPGRSRTDQ